MNKFEEIYNDLNGDAKEAMGKLVHSFAETIKENKRLQEKIDYMEQNIRLLRRTIYGQKSEKLSDFPTQEDLQLFNEFELIGEQIELEPVPELPETPTPKETKKKGRKPLPKNLPRIQVEHDLSPEDKMCRCGCEMECIGTQMSEELEYVAPKLQVLEHHCKKYICTFCAKNKEQDPTIQVTSKTGEKPLQLIEKSFASPGLLAHIAVSKFDDHLPLYRQEQAFQRLSIDLSRQTMSIWMLQAGKSVIPLINLMQENILAYPISFSDETTIQVLHEPERRAQTKSYIWCFIGGPPNKRVIIYQYHTTRAGEVATQFFEGYQGAIHCDGYGGYNALIKSEHIVGINCWAHARRKFIEALPTGKEKGVAGYVVKVIRLLYQIEENLKNKKSDADTIKITRQQQAKPILDKLKLYLDEKTHTTMPHGKLGEAIAYTLNRWPYLITYIEDGRYEIDNNRTERAIKPFVCGRKNWLFANSADGAHASARLFSLIETAKANKLNPTHYLKYLFKELPYCKKLEDYEALLPYNVDKASLKFSE